MYRPKNWVGDKPTIQCDTDKLCHDAFESGADAILQALIKEGEKSAEYVSTGIGLKKVFGYKVFIPNEK